MRKLLTVVWEVWWAQADIRNFYDRIEVGLVCRWLLYKGVEGWLRAAVFMLQMCSQIRFSIAGVRNNLMQRGRGSLTGSRAAGCCGAAIIADILEQVSKVVRPY